MAWCVATRLAVAGAIVCLVSAGHSGSQAAAKFLSTVELSNLDCSVADENKTACGSWGVGEARCVSQGCCFSNVPGVSWCFQSANHIPAPAPLPQCEVEDYLKRDCSPGVLIDQTGCEAKGCCWSPGAQAWLPDCWYDKDTATPPTPTPSPPPAGDFGRSPVVYQISTRPWLYELAQAGIAANCGNGRGTDYVCLRDVPDAEWQKIKDDSTDIVWLMGVWELGAEGLNASFECSGCRGWYESQLPGMTDDDVIGSPYAVVDYTLSSVIGNDEDLDTVKAKLNTMGMGLMVDFVPNHFARDAALFNNHPEAFIERPANDTSPNEWWHTKNGRQYAYGRGPYDGPWTDTFNINYWSPAAVALISDIFVNVAKRVDGIRLDMAMLPLNTVWEFAWSDVMAAGGWTKPETEFWQDVITLARAENPNVVIVAEVYDYYMTSPPEQEYLTTLGVDYAYEKKVLDVIEQGSPAHDSEANQLDLIRGYLFTQPQWTFDRMCHFVENHDERRSAVSLGGKEQAFAASVASWTLPGMRLSFFGQFDGLQNRLVVQLRRSAPESRDSELHARYTTLMGVLAQPIFHDGTWVIIDVPQPTADWSLFAWRWELSGEKRLVVVNWCDQAGTGYIPVDNAVGNEESGSVHLEDLLTGEAYEGDASQMASSGFAVTLQPWTAHIFTYYPVEDEDGARPLVGVVPFALILLSLVVTK